MKCWKHIKGLAAVRCISLSTVVLCIWFRAEVDKSFIAQISSTLGLVVRRCSSRTHTPLGINWMLRLDGRMGSLLTVQEQSFPACMITAIGPQARSPIE